MKLKKGIKLLTISGNFIFILWILINGINENFEGTIVEKASYLGLMLLLATNSYFILNKEEQR